MEKKDKRHLPIIFSCATIILVTFLSYSNSIPNPFLFDDEIIIQNNRGITSFENIKYLFSTRYFEIFMERTWRPITTLFYMLNYKLFGLDAPMWKIVSIFIHSFNGIFLYLAVRRYYGGLSAFFAGAIFITLPVNSEVVNSLAFIKDLLALFFALIAFAFFINGNILLSISAFIFSLLSKEMAVILPVIFILHDVILKGHKGDEILKRIKDIHIWYWTVLFIFLAIYFGIFQNPHGGDEYFGGRFSAWLINLSLIIIHDIKLLLTIVPNIDHIIEPYGIKAVFIWIPIILFASTFIIIYRSEKPIIFLFLWLIICLIPISGIIPLDQVIAERFLYWASFGFSGIIAILIFRLFKRYAVILLAGLLLFFIAVDFKRTYDWRDNLSLWNATTRNEPKSFRGRYNLANTYFNNGMIKEAVKEMKTAISIKPDYAFSYNMMGFFYFSANEYGLAEDNFRKAIEIKPTMAEAYNNLAMVLIKKGNKEEAIALLKKAIEIKPDYESASSNLKKIEGR